MSEPQAAAWEAYEVQEAVGVSAAVAFVLEFTNNPTHLVDRP